MSIFGLDLSATEMYELSFDTAKGTPDATVFELATLDSRIMGRIRDETTTLTLDRSEAVVDTQVNTQEMRFKAAMYGLRGWTNLNTRAGKQIVFATSEVTIGGFPYQVADPALLRQLPSEAIQEIGERIISRNTVTADEAKN